MSETTEEKVVDENIEKILNEVFKKASENNIFEFVVTLDGPGDSTAKNIENIMLAQALGRAIINYRDKNPEHNLTYLGEKHKFWDDDAGVHMVATIKMQTTDTIVREVFRTIQLATKAKNVQDLYNRMDSRLDTKNKVLSSLLEKIKDLEKLQDDACAACENPCRDKVEEDAFDDFMKHIIKMMTKN
jgi:hypothetical protein